MPGFIGLRSSHARERIAVLPSYPQALVEWCPATGIKMFTSLRSGYLPQNKEAMNTYFCRELLIKGHHLSHTTSKLSSSLTADTLTHWLALWFVPNIGPVRFFRLLEIFPDLSEVFKASAHQLSAIGLPASIIEALKTPNWKAVEQHLRWVEQPNHHIVTCVSSDYPVLLSHIAAVPPLLFVQGNLTLLQSQQLAVVGSRNPSPNGLDIAKRFSGYLSHVGLTITSGLALGIDAASHLGALENGGKTIAVLGTGLDCIYPKSHQNLAEQIIEKGALVSEYPLGTTAKPNNFPRRNRIISGLSLGVLVVEATLRSGSLITARLAVEQGREVFAVPGSIHNPLAKGCHDLIRQGAKLVETTQDILEELKFVMSVQDINHSHHVNKATALINSDITSAMSTEAFSRAVLDNIGFETTTIDALVVRTKQTVQAISSTLSLLELKGMIASVPGGYVKIRARSFVE